MSDSVSKWHDMQEEKYIKCIFESSDRPILSEGTKQQAYSILVEFSKDAILEAARMLRVGE